jgi:hypothetical protein
MLCVSKCVFKLCLPAFRGVLPATLSTRRDIVADVYPVFLVFFSGLWNLWLVGRLCVCGQSRVCGFGLHLCLVLCLRYPVRLCVVCVMQFLWRLVFL